MHLKRNNPQSKYHTNVYNRELDVTLCNVNIPCSSFGIPVSDIKACLITNMIDDYYSNIVNSIHNARKKSIPCKRVGNYASEHVVPGWNDCAKEKHDIARNAFLEWKNLGNLARHLLLCV